MEGIVEMLGSLAGVEGGVISCHGTGMTESSEEASATECKKV